MSWDSLRFESKVNERSHHLHSRKKSDRRAPQKVKRVTVQSSVQPSPNLRLQTPSSGFSKVGNSGRIQGHVMLVAFLPRIKRIIFRLLNAESVC